MSGDHNMYASSSGDGQRSGWRKRQILDMAEKASQSKQDWWKDDDALEAFAKLVREDEREACAQMCDDALKKIWEYDPYVIKHITANVCTNLAAAIRKRGQK